jgi:hypothetical protein
MARVIKTIEKFEQKDSGLIVPTTKQIIQEKFTATQHDSESYKVVNEIGEIQRIYSLQLHGKDYKMIAEGYAKKLSDTLKEV